MVPTNHDKAKQLLNAIFFIILAYQFVLLILGNIQYKPLGHIHDCLYVFSMIMIYAYLLISNTKEEGISWNRWRQKWFNLEDYENGELDKNQPERMYYLQKRLTLILVILFSTLAVIFAFINVIQNSLALFKYILSCIGLSALFIFVLATVLGLKIIIEFIQKPWRKDKFSLTFKLLLLQNFLISTAVLKMLANIQG